MYSLVATLNWGVALLIKATPIWVSTSSDSCFDTDQIAIKTAQRIAGAVQDAKAAAYVPQTANPIWPGPGWLSVGTRGVGQRTINRCSDQRRSVQLAASSSLESAGWPCDRCVSLARSTRWLGSRDRCPSTGA